MRVYHLDDRGTVIRLHYLLRDDPPTASAFQSRAERGLPVTDNLVAQRWSTGVSMNAPIEQVRATAARFARARWRFIAVLDLPTDGQQVHIQRTSASVGHFTVWGDPDEARRSVVAVISI
jgi:hypothetical protein